ncbi:hypothetical protein [uncultured Paraglaciecola sp.]|uniref:hypothetical protein n=1 Tax=uncultured Paraglaciecola sp. TaxID=1765024 RepID=UPI0030D6F71C|tara:strand:- start:71882 stop:72772 length:891 start_codon:yes stop_codon:yes gene_type:complete
MKLIKINYIAINKQCTKLARLPKKTIIKLGATSLLLSASTISNSVFSASSYNTVPWLSTTLLHKPIEENYSSIFKSKISFPIFEDVSSKYLADVNRPNYTKAVVLTLIRWVFGERSEREDSNEYVDVQKLVSIIIALHNSGTSNKMAIFLAYVQNDILQEVDKSNNKALDMLDKAATAKQKKHDKEFEDRMEFIQLARLRQVEASMKQYAVLNDKAYQLGFETFNRLEQIDVNLNTPIHQREAFKAGVEIGKRRYDLSVAERGLSSPPETDELPSSSEENLIEADKKTEKNEINLL